MRMSSFNDAMTVLRHYGIDPAAGVAIDVGGTPEVSLKAPGSHGVAANPILAVHPGVIFLDQGFNLDFIGTRTDHQLDFLDSSSLDPLRDQFDIVFCFDTLEHISNPFQFCGNLEKITRPGGTIYVSTLFRYVYHPSPEDYFRFSPTGLRQCFVDPANPARDRLSVAWCGWESDGDGVALLAVKGPAPERSPLELQRLKVPEPPLRTQARALLGAVRRRVWGG